MDLKRYQADTLAILRQFLQEARIAGPKAAYESIVNDPEQADRLRGYAGSYKALTGLPGIPYVCLRLPTGGGKTILAAHAVPLARDAWIEKDWPLVLWLVPTIDSLPAVRYWLRNVARHPESFWLPTARGKFYPDFVSRLTDDRLLVVEYKGDHLADSAETAEKRVIGDLWERRSGGKCLFLVVEKVFDGKDMRSQLQGKIGQ